MVQASPVCMFVQSVSIKTPHFRETTTSGTSNSETTYLLGLRLWLQGVLMSSPCCQISTPNRLVVSEYEVPKVLVSRKWWVFIETPGTCVVTMDVTGGLRVFTVESHVPMTRRVSNYVTWPHHTHCTEPDITSVIVGDVSTTTLYYSRVCAHKNNLYRNLDFS